MPEDSKESEPLDVEGQDDFSSINVRDGFMWKPDIVPQTKPKWKDAIPQVVASCIAHSIVIQAGVSMAYSAVLLPQLMEPDSTPTASKEECSWIASLVTIGTLVGSIVTGPLMDRLGRKTTCQLSCVPLIAAWVLVCLAQTVEMLYVGRLLAGIGGGLSTVSLVYVSEVSYPTIRPMLLCLNSVFVSFGILLACILAQWFDWRMMAIWFACLALFSLLTLFLLPESPHWLATYKHNKRNRMEAAVRWLNRHPQRYQQELKVLMETRQENENKKSQGPIYKRIANTFLVPSTLKPVILLLFIFLFQQLSGGYVVIFYAVHVFKMVGGTFGDGFDEYDALVLLGLIRFIMSVIAAVASRKFGRRPLMLLSGLGMCISTFVVGIYLHLKPIEFEEGFTSIRNSTEVIAIAEEERWTCVVCVLLYVCFSSLGFLIIPWTLIGELLPIKIRGICGGAMVGFAYVMMFGVVKSFPFVLDVTGAKGIFFFFSIMSLTGVAFVYIFLPETLGKTLKEIEDFFK